MDPESGAPAQPAHPSDGSGHPGTSFFQFVFRALWVRVHALIDVIVPRRQVGVENRFYFDEREKVWKLRGGETEQERLESEALRFHTSRGLTTTACDPSRGIGSNVADDLPPPPAAGGGKVTRPLHEPTASGNFSMASVAHPVYAPHGFADSLPSSKPQNSPPRAKAAGFADSLPSSKPQNSPPRAKAAGTAGRKPISSPFGLPAQATPLKNPFDTALRQPPASNARSAGSSDAPQQALSSPFNIPDPPGRIPPRTNPFSDGGAQTSQHSQPNQSAGYDQQGLATHEGTHGVTIAHAVI